MGTPPPPPPPTWESVPPRGLTPRGKRATLSVMASKTLSLRPAPKTLATRQTGQLAPRSGGQLEKPQPKIIDLVPANGKPGKSSVKKGGTKSGGSAANRTDGEETSGEKPPQKLSTLLVRGDRVAELLGGGEDAEAMVRQYALFQGNPRSKVGGTANRREGGTGYGAGKSSRRAAAPSAKPTSPKQPQPERTPLALPSPGAKPLALPAPGAKPLALPAPGTSGLTAQKPLAAPTSPEVQAQIDKIPPSIVRAQAIGIVRGVEDIVRSIFEPTEATTKKAMRAEQAIKKAGASGEIGKVIDLMAANAIEFEDEADKAKTYSWLERMIRKIQ